MRRLFTRLAVSLAVAFVVVPAATASAHAILDNSVPASGATLAKSPPQIVLDFDETVETSLGFVKLFASDGHRVDLSAIRRDSADSSIVRVDVPTLDDDTYVASYRVVSADGHPVEGAITFQVGTGQRADVSDVIKNALSDSATNSGVSDVGRAVRLVGYLAMAVMFASLFFVFGAVASDEVGRRLHRIVAGSASVLAVATSALVGLQGATAAGGGLAAAFDWSNVSGLLDTRTGHALAMRAIVAALVAFAFAVAGRTTFARAAGVVAIILVPLSFAFAGHPGAVSPAAPTVVASWIHVVSVSAWFGGLVLLVTVAELRVVDTVKWFSVRAAWLIGAVVVTGVAQSLLIVEDIGAVTDITYGKTLIAKVVLVGVMLLTAAVVRRRFSDSGVANLRSVLVVEAAIGLLVLGVTSGLVVETPRVTASAAPFSTALVQGETIVDVSISPARVGSVEMHVIVTTPGGSLEAVKSAKVRLSLASRDVPPVGVSVVSVGPNHFVGTAAIPYAGDWKLDVIVVDAADREILFTTTAPIRS